MCIRDRPWAGAARVSACCACKCNAGRKPCEISLGSKLQHLAGIALRTGRCRPAEAAVRGQGRRAPVQLGGPLATLCCSLRT
eukprot:11068042-Alexandrium_andersonii.AAC.1